MTDDLDDLIGAPSVVAPKNRGGRPKGSKNKPKQPPVAPPTVTQNDDALWNNLPPDAVPDPTVFRRPIHRTALATILGKEPRRLVAQLEACPVIAYTGGGQPLYDFKEALRYVVEPAPDAIAAWIKSQSSTSLPPLISKAFWEGEAAKQRVLKAAGELWGTEDVLAVLGRTAINIKDTVQLWIENLPGRHTLTAEQYDALRRETADLLDDIYQRLVEMPKERQTRPSSAVLEAEMAGPEGELGE